MSGGREVYLVSVVRPEGVTKAEMAEYIKDAVETWGGGYSPDDPLFNVGDYHVAVRSTKFHTIAEAVAKKKRVHTIEGNVVHLGEQK